MKFKRDQKVLIRGEEGIIVYIDPNPDAPLQYLCMIDGAKTVWKGEIELQPICKFKVGDIWRNRNGVEITLVSISELDMLGLSNPNTINVDTWFFELDGRYYPDKEDENDLVEKVR